MEHSNLGLNKTQAVILGLIGFVIFVSGTLLSYFRTSDSLIGLILINIGLWIHLYSVYFYGITNYPKWIMRICVWGNCGMSIGIILMLIVPQVR
ncbi:hypothetical protein JT359_02265 [Candidatus Poribacteria bacterium]|nr:hypothetical protein [Candidatus Poribacteria bacterium]